MIEKFKNLISLENELSKQFEKLKRFLNNVFRIFLFFLIIELFFFFSRDEYEFIFEIVFIIPLAISLFYLLLLLMLSTSENSQLKRTIRCRKKYGPIILSDLHRFYEIQNDFQRHNNLTSLQFQEIPQKVNEELFLDKQIEWDGVISDIINEDSKIIISINVHEFSSKNYQGIVQACLLSDNVVNYHSFAKNEKIKFSGTITKFWLTEPYWDMDYDRPDNICNIEIRLLNIKSIH